MSKHKWQSKLVNLAVAFALVVSLGVVAVMPVASPVLAQVCGVELTANITSPADEAEFCACTYFSLNVTIGNTNATCNASSVQFIVWPGEKAEVVIGGVGQGAGTVKTFDVGFLPANTSANRTVQMHCVAAGETSIHVIPGGWDDCEHRQIPSACIHSDIVDILQKAPELDLDLSVDDKVCYCDNFTATVTVDNTGTGDVSDVLPSLNVTPGTGATLLQGPNSANISAGNSATFNWTYHCDEAGSLNVTLTGVAAIDDCTTSQIADSLVSGVPQTKEVTQYKAHLVVGLEVPDAAICVGQNFTAVVAINNTGNSNASGVNVTMNVTGPANCMPDTSPTWSDETVNADSEWSQNWTCNCTAGGNVTISVTNVTGMMCAEANGQKAIPQDNIEMPDPVTVVQYGALNLTCDVDVGTVCQETSFTANATGGAENYTWYWEFGDALHATEANPNTSTEKDPTHIYMCAGNYTATVTVTDSACGNKTCSKPVNVTIPAPALVAPIDAVKVTDPDGVTFNWTDIGCCNYTLQVFQKDGDGEKVLLVQTGHNVTWTWEDAMTGNWKWRVMATDSCNQSSAWSDWEFFQYDPDEEYPDVTVFYPNGGETFLGGSQETITWHATESPFRAAQGGFEASQENLVIDIYFSSDGGANWEEVATGEENDGAYPWTVPSINSDQCLVRVDATDDVGNTGTDTSDAVFTITIGVVVSIGDAAVTVNGTAVVPININGVTDLAAVEIWLTYGNTVVEVTDVTAGDLGALTSFSIDNAGGVTKMNRLSGTGQTGDFVFANIELHAVGSAGDTSALDLDVKSLVDSNGVDIPHAVEDGVFTIIALMEGDANLDGCVSIVDALFIAQKSLGLRILDADQLICGDTNDDGAVDMLDALHIAQWRVDPDGTLGVLLMGPLWDAVNDAGITVEPIAC